MTDCTHRNGSLVIGQMRPTRSSRRTPCESVVVSDSEWGARLRKVLSVIRLGSAVNEHDEFTPVLIIVNKFQTFGADARTLPAAMDFCHPAANLASSAAASGLPCGAS